MAGNGWKLAVFGVFSLANGTENLGYTLLDFAFGRRVADLADKPVLKLSDHFSLGFRQSVQVNDSADFDEAIFPLSLLRAASGVRFRLCGWDSRKMFTISINSRPNDTL